MPCFFLLQRHFVTFGIGFPGPTSLQYVPCHSVLHFQAWISFQPPPVPRSTIYNTFLNGHLQHFNEEIQGLSSGIVNGALSIHGDIAKTFRKSAINFHYEFNIRHMSNVFSGILMAQPEKFAEPAKVRPSRMTCAVFIASGSSPGVVQTFHTQYWHLPVVARCHRFDPWMV